MLIDAFLTSYVKGMMNIIGAFALGLIGQILMLIFKATFWKVLSWWCVFIPSYLLVVFAIILGIWLKE